MSGLNTFCFRMIPRTLLEPLKIGKTGKTSKRAWSYLDRDPGRWLAFEMRWQASDTQEYPSLSDTFWRTHTVDGVFPKDEDHRIYEEMKRLEATGEYTEDEINALARGGKLRGSDSKYSDMFKEFESGGASGSGGCGDDEESGDDEDGDGDD
ncbi:hypothetical protein Tco_1480031 [Tanacetum coccineum]